MGAIPSSPDDSRFEVPVDVDHHPTIVTLEGELDLATAPVLLGVLDAIGSGHGSVTIDCSGLTFVDLAGLRACAAACDRARAPDGRYRVRGLTPFARRIATLAGLAELLDPQRHAA